MQEKVRWKFLISDTRSQVYLLWAVIVAVGFVTTHNYQRKEINIAWFALSVLGLGFMLKVMPLKIRQMKLILLSWLVPVTFGMAVSYLAFRLDSLLELTGYLGVFWLFVMAAGYIWNGIVDPPSKWYFIAAGMNIIAGVLCYFAEPFLVQQYLIAAIISTWSMLNLWLLRT